MNEVGGEGWGAWRVLPRLVGSAVTVPVVFGFVALGAAVLVMRSVREVVRETWLLVPSLRGPAQLTDRRATLRVERNADSDAA